MSRIGIALDIGTSGFRAQAIDLEGGQVMSTAITTRHPIPGSNVIDHVNFAIINGRDQTNRLMIETINLLLPRLEVDLSKVVRMAVCGNPFQLSLFQNIEIRDLAYAGKNKLEKLGVVSPKRDGEIVKAGGLGLCIPAEADVYIPPAVSHEIGADAIAMLLMTGIMEQKEPCLVVDYGTNAEMALVKDGKVYSGSAAAGPALEGQQIERGMLAAPGAISDVNITPGGWACSVLDEGFEAREGDTVDPSTGGTVAMGAMHGMAKGITGTGVIAAIACGIESGLIRPPKVLTPDKLVHLQDGITISEEDVAEAGKAIGALRAGYLTLMLEAGIWIDDVRLAYMSGASGLYVDAVKAQSVGLTAPKARNIIQLGNTSLALAKQLVIDPAQFEGLRTFAKDLRAAHCMFATSERFKDIYSVELSLWMYGMPFSMYNEMMDLSKLPHLEALEGRPNVERRMSRDIPDFGSLGMHILTDIGVMLGMDLEGCIVCRKCEKECPEQALSIIYEGPVPLARVRSELCSGTACRRCEQVCRSSAISFKEFRLVEGK